MPYWYTDNSQAIGKPPLVRLNRITGGAAAIVLAKIEGRNPAYSVKCRIGAAMVWDVEQRGLVEPSSGSTTIVLAFVAAARGLPLALTNVGKTIVVVFSDSVWRYLSSPLFEGMFDASGMAA